MFVLHAAMRQTINNRCLSRKRQLLAFYKRTAGTAPPNIGRTKILYPSASKPAATVLSCLASMMLAALPK